MAYILWFRRAPTHTYNLLSLIATTRFQGYGAFIPRRVPFHRELVERRLTLVTDV